MPSPVPAQLHSLAGSSGWKKYQIPTRNFSLLLPGNLLGPCTYSADSIFHFSSLTEDDAIPPGDQAPSLTPPLPDSQ